MEGNKGRIRCYNVDYKDGRDMCNRGEGERGVKGEKKEGLTYIGFNDFCL